jgi:ketosteroid isomerase-like protein
MSATHGPSPAHFAVAGLFLDALAAQDFDGLAAALDHDATLCALLPRGYDEWHGATAIAAAFRQWFGDTEAFEVADASVGQVGALLQLRWRLRVKAERRGDGTMVVEQNAFAETGCSGHIQRMSLLCSGFWAEHTESTPTTEKGHQA